MNSTQLYCRPENSKWYDNVYDILGDFELIKKNKYLNYYNIPCVFDIETSSFYNEYGDKQSLMYAWVLGINGRCVRGRTWNDFTQTLNKIKNFLNTDLSKRLIIYVHNLAFEFQFMNHYFKWSKVFSLDERKPVYCIEEGGIEFRCSYILTNYNLETLGKNLTKYKVNKLVGDLDYEKIHTPATPLTDTEWGYILNDGLVVMAHIQEEIEYQGSIKNIPITSTSYVRRYCKNMCFNDEKYKYDYSKTMRSMTLDRDTYLLSKRAFSGGFTHANINYVDKIMKNVHSYDFTSSYPSVMCSEMFPMSKPHKKFINSKEQLEQYCSIYCCMFNVRFDDICAKVDYENYISVSKCWNIINPVLNNGRIIEADSITLTITEQDYYIIKELYSWSTMYVNEFYYCYKDYLPKPIIEAILTLYKQKTTLKGVEGKENEYLKSKQMINSCYGMCVTDICRDENIFNDDYEWSTREVDIEKALNYYNNNTQRVLFYLWGVWVTAYARRNLFKGINEFKEDYLYSDTDSIKCINIENHKKFIKDYNEEITKKLEKCLNYRGLDIDLICPKTIKGDPKPLGVWDYEGCYTMFKTLGAKRYMYVQDNQLHITIAGVGKKTGATYLMEKYKTFDNVFKNFTDDLLFPKEYVNSKGEVVSGTGKLCHTYIDIEMKGIVTDYLGKDYTYYEMSGIHLEKIEYRLGLDEQFIRLIQGIKGGELC